MFFLLLLLFCIFNYVFLLFVLSLGCVFFFFFFFFLVVFCVCFGGELLGGGDVVRFVFLVVVIVVFVVVGFVLLYSHILTPSVMWSLDRV